MFDRKDSEIELQKIKTKKTTIHFNVENAYALITSLMVTPDVNIQSFQDLHHILEWMTQSQDQIIKNTMKMNAAAMNKNPKHQRCLERFWGQYDKPLRQTEKSEKTFSIKAF